MRFVLLGTDTMIRVFRNRPHSIRRAASQIGNPDWLADPGGISDPLSGLLTLARCRSQSRRAWATASGYACPRI